MCLNAWKFFPNVWKNEDVPQKLKAAVTIAISEGKGEQYVILCNGKHILANCLTCNIVISEHYSFKCKWGISSGLRWCNTAHLFRTGVENSTGIYAVVFS